MEELKDIGRQSSLRSGGNLKSTLSGRSTPRGSPTFRRVHSGRTPRREGRASGGSFQWIRSNRLLLWLLLITLWAYLGFYVQSKWAHGDNDKEAFVGYKSKTLTPSTEKNLTRNNATNEARQNQKELNSKNMTVILSKKGNRASTQRKTSLRKTKRLTLERRSRGKARGKNKVVADDNSRVLEEVEEEIPKRNTTYGLLVGPFGSTEDKILEWSAERRTGTCDRKDGFARLVWSRKFVLIFHELSMTGAPLSMMELATELLSCGATVSAVVLSRKGGLMGELNRRRIKVVEDKGELSYKTAMKSDLIIAGSAVCASWIEQYIAHSTPGSGQIAWWIMENRKEYFDRSKSVLGQVKMLAFLSESQSTQWLAWCKEEGIELKAPPELVPLSVNDELAFVAGIPSSLNTPSFTVEKMLERRHLLRDAVRKEMGLTDNDMLAMSLSSINPGKGQLLLFESARLLVEQNISTKSSGRTLKDIPGIGFEKNSSTLTRKRTSRTLFRKVEHFGRSSNGSPKPDKSREDTNKPKRKKVIPTLFSNNTKATSHVDTDVERKMLSDNEDMREQTLKLLIGSVGSKSNKIPYVKGLLKYLTEHPELSRVVLWTPATTRVASLYSAADVYIINSQGLGETFGRVTIEAMAFGLPVLGTDAGGTREIVEHNITGLLHPLGRLGNEVLAKNLLFLLKNPASREQMGIRGRNKVEKMYLKRHMYRELLGVFLKCMRIK